MELEGLNSWPSFWPDWIHSLKHTIFFSNWNLLLQKEHSKRSHWLQDTLIFNIGYKSVSQNFLATSRLPAPKSPILKMWNLGSHFRSNASWSLWTCPHNVRVCTDTVKRKRKKYFFWVIGTLRIYSFNIMFFFLAHLTFYQMETCTKF